MCKYFFNRASLNKEINRVSNRDQEVNFELQICHEGFGLIGALASFGESNGYGLAS
jgi:hypothetical protein